MHGGSRIVLVLGLVASGLWFAAGAAEMEKQQRTILAASGDRADAGVAYKPPVRGAPARRVGGSSRGTEQALPSLGLLAPDHVGYTVSAQPVLYWYLSKSTSVRIELTVIDDKGINPLVERTVSDVQPGIQRLNLADLSVTLKPGEEYQWSVSLVPDPRERSNDVIAAAAVKRVDIPPSLAPQLASASREELPGLYAGEGIWYDAIAVLSELIQARPGDRKLREQRAALLDQAGLAEVAAFDRAQGSSAASNR